MDSQIRDLLIILLKKSNFDAKATATVGVYLMGDEQRWQMIQWLLRMMGPELDQPLTFQEVWYQAEKIKATIPEED